MIVLRRPNSDFYFELNAHDWGKWSRCHDRCDFVFIAASPIVVGGITLDSRTGIAAVVMYVLPKIRKVAQGLWFLVVSMIAVKAGYISGGWCYMC